MKVAVCRPLTPCHLGKRHAASPPRTPQPPRLPHPAVSRRVPPGRQPNHRGAAAQLASSESRPAAVTSESHPFRIHNLSRQAVRGPVQSLKVARGLMPLSLVSSPRDSTRHGRPGSSGVGTGRLVPEIGLRSRRHHQHHGSYAPGPMERHETPDPVRSYAVNSRFHGVRHQADLHDQHQLIGNTVLVC
jgi:hypothetical protein